MCSVWSAFSAARTLCPRQGTPYICAGTTWAFAAPIGDWWHILKFRGPSGHVDEGYLSDFYLVSIRDLSGIFKRERD
jgi:hypothetical protein